MRKITINYEDAAPTVIFDNSNVERDQYCNELAGILKESNITILKTSKQTTILRPSKIIGIEIEEQEENKIKPTPTPPKTRELTDNISIVKTKKPSKKNEDKITDVK